MNNNEQLQIFPPRPSGRACLSVSQITARIKGVLEGDIGEVWIKGEISGYRPSAAGHRYFNLKDSGAVLSCAMFRGAGHGSNSKPKFDLKDGLEVIAKGRISVYPPRGNYQLIVESLEPMGAGSLQLAFEQLKAKLMSEGLFDTARKKPIPAYPTRVAIITSPTGAALHDMLNVLGRRNAGISILVVPALVQGEAAPAQLMRGVQVANQHNLGDVIVLARGGGSMEDLWCFNDENLVRAVAASRIPTISAVGHEVDFTLCDFAADLRAPTPSAAAELVSKSRLELVEALLATERRLSLAMAGKTSRFESMLLALETRLVSPVERLTRLRKQLVEWELRLGHSMESRIPIYRQMVDDASTRIFHLTERALHDKRKKVEIFSGRLEALSPLKVLGRGYTLVQEAATGRLIKSSKEASGGMDVALVFHDGKAQAKIQ